MQILFLDYTVTEPRTVYHTVHMLFYTVHCGSYKSSLFSVFISTTTMQVLDLHKSIGSMLLKGMFQVKNKLNSVDTQFGLVSQKSHVQ